MPSSHLILCRPLFLLPPIHLNIRVFYNESTLHMRWPKYWSFNFTIIPSKEHPGSISFRMDWLDLLAVHGTLKSLLQLRNRTEVSCIAGRFLTSWATMETLSVQFSSVTQLCPTLCDPMNHSTPGLPVHHQLLEFTQTQRPSSQWHHPAISSSVIPFSSCPQSLPASESFPMSQFFSWGGQSTGVSALASFLPCGSQKVCCCCCCCCCFLIKHQGITYNIYNYDNTSHISTK